MMKSLASSLLLALIATTASAYDPDYVHYPMTGAAFDMAAAKNGFVKRLGLTDSTKVKGKLPVIWAADGAKDEDWMTRPLSHFYDPINDIPLSAGPCPKLNRLGMPAPEYALGDLSQNGHGLEAARVAYRTAISGSTRLVREHAFADLFKSLGHMMHLVEDMAQPEHTRNDQHHPWLGGSLYEEWSKNLIAAPARINQQPGDWFRGYPLVELPAYRDYFSNVATRRGMADYSNQGFVTRDTNFLDPVRQCPRFDYALPALPQVTRDEYRVETVKIPLFGPFYQTATKSVKVTFYDSVPQDNYQAQNDPAGAITVRSYLDYETRIYLDPVTRVPAPFSENDDVYLHKARRLLPRGTSYAAGLVNHFFRGIVDVEWLRGSNPYVYEARITNKSAEPLTDASLEVWLTDPTTGEALSVLQMNLPDLAGKGDAASIVTLPALITGIALGPNQSIFDFERRILVEGTLGAEQGAVIGAVQPPSNGKLLGYRASLTPAGVVMGIMALPVDASAQWEMLLPTTVIPNDNVWAPFGPGASYGRIAPNGRYVAARGGAWQDPLTITNITVGLQARWQITPRLSDGSQIYHDAIGVWTPDSTHLVLPARRACHLETPDEQVCRDSGYWARGVAIVNVFSGLTEFHHIREIKWNTPDSQAPGVGAISDDGRFVVAVGGGGATRWDLLSRQLQRATTPAPLGQVWSADGSTIYIMQAGADLSGFFATIWQYVWNGPAIKIAETTTAGRVDPFGGLALSPDRQEIAFGRMSARCGGKLEQRVLTLATGIERAASSACPDFTNSLVAVTWLPD